MIKAYYHHWPERHPTQFNNETELRKWAQMEAGYFEIRKRVQVSKFPFAVNDVNQYRVLQFLDYLVTTDDEYTVTTFSGGDLIVKAPKSIKFNKLDRNGASKLFDEVGHVLYQQSGIEIGRASCRERV